MDLVVCTGLRRHDHVVLCLAHRVRTYMKTYIFDVSFCTAVCVYTHMCARAHAHTHTSTYRYDRHV